MPGRPAVGQPSPPPLLPLLLLQLLLLSLCPPLGKSAQPVAAAAPAAEQGACTDDDDALRGAFVSCMEVCCRNECVFVCSSGESTAVPYSQ
jgi:hypothetical protein